MNRRDFLARLAQSTAAVPTTYFFFGSLWRPQVNPTIELVELACLPFKKTVVNGYHIIMPMQELVSPVIINPKAVTQGGWESEEQLRNAITSWMRGDQREASLP